MPPEPLQFPYNDVIAKLAVALGAGLLVGLEREWANKEVGVRTFAIVALLGALTSLLPAGLAVAAFVGVLLLAGLLNAQTLLKDRSLELTTTAALFVNFFLGVLAGQGHYFTTAAAAILLTMLLAWKFELSRFADALRPEEIRGAALLGLLSVIIYPLLPNEFVDPWKLVNPRAAWVTVVVIAGIGFVNYALLRIYSNKGLYYAALLGGMVNSTAAVAELSALFKDRPAEASVARPARILLLTNVAMFLRNLVILAIFGPRAVVLALPALGLMVLGSVGFAVVGARNHEPPEGQLKLSSPVSLVRVLKFGVIFLALAATGTLAQRYLGHLGFLAVSFLGGMVSSASTTASAASLVSTEAVSPMTAAAATVLTSIASAAVNLPLVYQATQNRALTRRLAFITGVITALGLAGMGAVVLVVP